MKLDVEPFFIIFIGIEMKRLSLSSNNLKTLPDEIGACTALKELYVNNNAKFSMLPGAAGHLR